MARIAEAMEYAKSTIYQHFSCKEEIIVALAAASVERQRELVERAAMFRGRPRERMFAVGTATELYARLYGGDARIFQLMNAEDIAHKASEKYLWPMKTAAHRTVSILNGIVRDAIAQGDLTLDGSMTAEELTYQMWLLGESGKASASSWLPPQDMGVSDPLGLMTRHGQLLGDAFRWRPLSSEWDYAETLARVRREVFPEETRKVYGADWEQRYAEGQ